MPDPNRIPLEVNVFICTACGAQAIDHRHLQCREEHKGEAFSIHYEIAAAQHQQVAKTRVADLKRHGGRLLSEAANG
jgi:hypothetical protein